MSTALSPSVEFATLEGACLDAGAKAITIPPGRSCSIAIPASDDDVRQMKLSLSAGSLLTGRYIAPPSTERLGNQKVELRPTGRASMTLAVVKEPGTLTLRRQAQGAACVIEVK